MSFGYSVGDFIGVGQLAWRVYRACKDAPEEYLEISRELCTLHIVLKDLEDDAGNPSSVLNRRGPNRRGDLLQLRDNIQVTLRELEDIVNRYRSLSTKEKGAWRRMRFASKNTDEIRGKLVFYTSSIGLFNQSLCVGALARIEEKLELIVREVQAGKRPDASVTSVYSNASASASAFSWRELEKELEAEGISVSTIRLHKEDIKETLRNLMGGENAEDMSLPGTPKSTSLGGMEGLSFSRPTTPDSFLLEEEPQTTSRSKTLNSTQAPKDRELPEVVSPCLPEPTPEEVEVSRPESRPDFVPAPEPESSIISPPSILADGERVEEIPKEKEEDTQPVVESLRDAFIAERETVRKQIDDFKRTQLPVEKERILRQFKRTVRQWKGL